MATPQATAAASTPRDGVTGLQLAVSDMCALYASAVGEVQNEADKQWQQAATSGAVEPIADDFASRIVQAHREFERLVTELESSYRPESEQLRVLNELRERDATMTRELRQQTESAEVVREKLQSQLDILLDGVQEVHTSHRVANL